MTTWYIWFTQYLLMRVKKKKTLPRISCVSNFPEDLINDVLSRLPVKTLLRFRCVSKRWCALIDSPNFINLQLNQSLNTNSNLAVILEYHKVYKLCSLGFDPLEDILKHGDDKVATFLEKTVKLDYHPLKSKDFCIVGSCNGLICLVSPCSKIAILLNPSAKKYQILPPVPPPSFQYWLQPVCGFGYDPVNDDYKTVIVYEHRRKFPEVIVYSLKSNIWRRIDHSFPHLLKHNFYSVFCNGALHWVAKRRSKSPVDKFIAAFDLVVENFREVKLPNILDYRSVTLGVSGGCLWLGCVYYKNAYLVELWVMKDYMVQESWTKLSIPFLSQLYKTISKVRILAYSTSSNKVLLTQINSALCWLDLEEQKVVDLDMGSSRVEICIASLVKLPYDQGT